ncbi:MAG: hypothetical protein KC466_06700 [Myxococcales bacterium]|nr:hypothetical protein [Myxococcales bacterium]
MTPRGVSENQILVLHLPDPGYFVDRLGPRECLPLEYVRADLESAEIPFLWMDAANDPMGSTVLRNRLAELRPEIIVAYGTWDAFVDAADLLGRYRGHHVEVTVVALGDELNPMAAELLDAFPFIDAVVLNESSGVVSRIIGDRARGQPILAGPAVLRRRKTAVDVAEPEPPQRVRVPTRHALRRWMGEGLVPTASVALAEKISGEGPEPYVWKSRPVEDVLTEIRTLVEQYGPRGLDPILRFVGRECLRVDRYDHLRAFADGLARAGLGVLFELGGLASEVADLPESLLRSLQHAGLRIVHLDLTPRTPAEVTQDGLGIREEAFAQSVKRLRAAGIEVALENVALLGPFQTAKGYERALRYLESLHLSFLLYTTRRVRMLPNSPYLLPSFQHGLIPPSYEFGRVHDYGFVDPAIAAITRGLDGPGWEVLTDELECIESITRELIVLDDQAERSGAFASRRFKLLYMGERSKVTWAIRSLSDLTGDYLRTSVMDGLRRGKEPGWNDWRRHFRHVARMTEFVHLTYAKFIQRIQERAHREG